MRTHQTSLGKRTGGFKEDLYESFLRDTGDRSSKDCREGPWGREE